MRPIYERVIIHYWKNKKRLLKEYLEAMEELLENYILLNRGEILSMPRCPLCTVEAGKDCDNCPWRVISGLGSKSKHSGDSCIPVSDKAEKNLVVRRNRIYQLRRWIGAYRLAGIKLNIRGIK